MRTGGHQYSGACSTRDENILVDLSNTFKSEEDFQYDESKNLLRVGVSYSLLELLNRLREKKSFLPTGQCVHVHLGGHLQTGGYGQLSRSHGLLCDHCVGFDIVLASGEHRKIWIPDSEMGDKNRTQKQKMLDDDLFWAGTVMIFFSNITDRRAIGEREIKYHIIQ